MPEVARDADLFICECYYHQKPVRFHMNYPKLKEHWHEITAKRTVLTLGAEVPSIVTTISSLIGSSAARDAVGVKLATANAMLSSAKVVVKMNGRFIQFLRGATPTLGDSNFMISSLQ